MAPWSITLADLPIAAFRRHRVILVRGKARETSTAFLLALLPRIKLRREYHDQKDTDRNKQYKGQEDDLWGRQLAEAFTKASERGALGVHKRTELLPIAEIVT